MFRTGSQAGIMLGCQVHQDRIHLLALFQGADS